MSRLARRVALVALMVLGVQFAGALAIQFVLSQNVRSELIRQLTHGMEDSGALEACTARPGPWEHSDGWWVGWPLTADGVPVGQGAPLDRVELPARHETMPWSTAEHRGLVFGSASDGCGGVLMMQRKRYPLFEAESTEMAALVGLRVALVPLAAIALVALTAFPLVRRIRRLSQAMGRAVEDGFDTTVDDHADDELGEVARAFDFAATAARERLERLEHRDAVMRRALADLAHDLRTPLATLQLSAPGLPASTAATTIRTELSFLEGMTENFEALLGGEDDGDRERVALDRLAERVEHRFAPLARDRELSFDVALPDEGLHVEAESVGLERAVGNLLQNALRFANEHVVLLVFRDGEHVRLEVRDDGPGFGALSGRAAERGVRSDQAAGFGLGLAIAEASARRYGGRLELGEGEDGETLVALVLPEAGVA